MGSLEPILLLDIFHAYQRRYDLEHFFRFGKQRLLMNRYQTPKTEHEEKWWFLANLAYLQLWLAHPVAQTLSVHGRHRLAASYVPLRTNNHSPQCKSNKILHELLRSLGHRLLLPNAVVIRQVVPKGWFCPIDLVQQRFTRAKPDPNRLICVIVNVLFQFRLCRTFLLCQKSKIGI